MHTAFFTKDHWFEMILILGWLSVIFALKVYSFFFFFLKILTLIVTDVPLLMLITIWNDWKVIMLDARE